MKYHFFSVMARRYDASAIVLFENIILMIVKFILNDVSKCFTCMFIIYKDLHAQYYSYNTLTMNLLNTENNSTVLTNN